MLPYGTKTYTRAIRTESTSSTIYLIFNTLHLIEEKLIYKIYDIEYSSDYSVIKTFFLINQPIPACNTDRRLFKNIFYNNIKTKVFDNLISLTILSIELDFHSIQLINIIKVAIAIYFPLAKLSLYIKRW